MRRPLKIVFLTIQKNITKPIREKRGEKRKRARKREREGKRERERKTERQRER